MKTAVTAVVITLMAVSMASGNLRAYAIDPVRADWSGKADPEDGVAQTVTCNFDSLSYVELFAGAKDAGGAYRAGVWLDGSEIMWSYGDTVPDHGWVKSGDWGTEVALTKGKKLTIRLIRSEQDSSAEFPA